MQDLYILMNIYEYIHTMLACEPVTPLTPGLKLPCQQLYHQSQYRELAAWLTELSS